jgi:hypothetical protein
MQTLKNILKFSFANSQKLRALTAAGICRAIALKAVFPRETDGKEYRDLPLWRERV